MKKTTDQMTQDMIDGALNSKSNISVDGSNISVNTRNVEQEAKETDKLNKQAIHQALNEASKDLSPM